MANASLNTTMLGKFQVIKRLAAGGMAELFLARERGFSGVDKLVVLKRILPQHLGNGDYLRMFHDEARISALLQHQNLVQMFEMGSIDGMEFISMEYLHGEDVRSVYRALRERGQSLPMDVAFSIATGVAAGLHYAHARIGIDGTPLNIVHRDISPANVVVTYEGGVKLVDFGIARAENRDHQTNAAIMKGKIPYMAPEQVLGHGVDRRTDLYSLGVLLFEMTTGQRPFRHESDIRLMRAIAEDPVPPPNRLIPGYPAELSAIVLKALEKDPAARFQTGQEFQGALEDFARKKGLALSNIGLSKYMHALFGERADMYRQVLAGLAPAEVLPVEGLGAEFAKDKESGSGVAADVPTSPSMKLVSPNSDLAQFSRVGAVTVLELKGRLNEKFSGADIGRMLNGDVVVDASRVERVTSYGVREWLQMLGAARATGLYFVRCSEAVINQAATVRGFLGNGHVVSFLAPYACRECGHAFNATIDMATYFSLLATKQMPPLACPRCQAPADFDDDPKSYLAFVPKALPTLSAEVQEAIASRALAVDAAGEHVEKSVDGGTTRVRIAVADSSVRWARVFDGVEGELKLVFDPDATVDAAGISALMAALASVSQDVTRVTFEAAPRLVVEVLPRLDVIRVQSVRLEGKCPSCQAVRSAIAPWESTRASLAAGQPPTVPCRRCGASLQFGDLSWLGRPEARSVLLAEAPTTPEGQAAAALMVAVPSQPLPVIEAPVVPSPPAAPARLNVQLVALAAAVVVLGGVLTWVLTHHVPKAEVPGPVVAASAGDDFEVTVRPPLWAESGPQVVDGEVVLVGVGGPASVPQALEAARADALVRLTKWVIGQVELPARDVLRAKLAQGTLDDATAAARVARRLGLETAPRLINAVRQGPVEAAQVWARFATPGDLATKATAAFGASVPVAGATLMALPPLGSATPEAGALIVVSVNAGPALAAGLRVGDLVLEANGTPVPDVAALQAVLSANVGKPVTFKTSAGGVTRAIRFSP